MADYNRWAKMQAQRDWEFDIARYQRLLPLMSSNNVDIANYATQTIEALEKKYPFLAKERKEKSVD